MSSVIILISRNVITGYVYNVSNTNGAPVSALTPQENNTFNTEVSNNLQTSDLYLRYGTVIYLGPITDLTSTDHAFTVDLIGDIVNSQRGAVIMDIENAWKNANPGNGIVLQSVVCYNFLLFDYVINSL